MGNSRYKGEKLIRVEVDESLKKKFRAICNARQSSMSAVLAKLIEEWVSENEDVLDNSQQK